MIKDAEILIIDDEDDIRNLIKGILEDEGYQVRTASGSEQAYEAVSEKVPSLVVLDIWLQGSRDDGLDILKNLKKEHAELPFVMISGHGTIETAVAAIKDGAYDFIEKPFKSDRLLMMVERALEHSSLRQEIAALKKRAPRCNEDLIGKSSAIQSVREVIERAAPGNSRILITGEAGTGKSVVARLIHGQSTRSEGAFLSLNCATLLPERLEVELFGIEASENNGKQHIGILEHAHNGTLLLDGVGDMPLETQSKIVRVIQEQEFQRIGSQKRIEVDVRILATSNQNLEEAIRRGDFREDLYYRLNVVQIEMPSLRERSEDIPDFVAFFLKALSNHTYGRMKSFSTGAMHILKSYEWPGNIRQLKNIVECVHIMHEGDGTDSFIPEHLPPEIQGKRGHESRKKGQGGAGDDYLDLPLRDAREAFEREYLFSQVRRFDGNISKTAEFVGMERSALHRKLKSLQISDDKDDASKNVTLINQKRA